MMKYPYIDLLKIYRNKPNQSLNNITYGIGILIGGYFGWEMGSEIIDIVNNISQEPNTIETLIKSNPIVTKLVTSVLSIGTLNLLLRIPERLIYKNIKIPHAHEKYKLKE